MASICQSLLSKKPHSPPSKLTLDYLHDTFHDSPPFSAAPCNWQPAGQHVGLPDVAKSSGKPHARHTPRLKLLASCKPKRSQRCMLSLTCSRAGQYGSANSWVEWLTVNSRHRLIRGLQNMLQVWRSQGAPQPAPPRNPTCLSSAGSLLHGAA